LRRIAPPSAEGAAIFNPEPNLPHALIVDDDVNTRDALAELINAEGLTVAQAADLRAARIHMVRQTPDIIFIDLKLPDGTGTELFDNFEPNAGIDVVIITGHASVDSAVHAMKLGATDYLVKPINLARVRTILERMPRTGDLQAEVELLRGELRRYGRFGAMLGQSVAMQTLYDQMQRIAPTGASVLLMGESGTGKELAARTVHELSRRRKRAFLAVNCGAIAPQLIESEMFGHERGAFTGADRQHKGYFEHADSGTLFLDEITEMPVELQVKLLRVLESGAFMRVGATRETEVDVRVIAATNRDPEEAVFEGKLRVDLYHRLNVFPLQLPPLRERQADIDLLAQHFLAEFTDNAGPRKHFTPAVVAALGTHPWPGNVRELRNFVQRATILAPGDTIDTPPVVQAAFGAHESRTNVVTVPVGTSLEAANRELIYVTLEQCDGVKTRAAEILGISLKTLYNRLALYESERADTAPATATDPQNPRPGAPQPSRSRAG
jgi:DNA-binding NtrC family response regulator